MTKEKLIKSKQRVKKFGEVFTPEHIVKQMCDITEPDISDPNKTVLEPTCGNGNFIVEILNRKLDKIQTNPTDDLLLNEPLMRTTLYHNAVASIYGVDIQLDNVIETRERMMKIIKQRCFDDMKVVYVQLIKDPLIISDIIIDDLVDDYIEHTFTDILKHNIRQGNFLYYTTEGASDISLTEWFYYPQPDPEPSLSWDGKKPKKSRKKPLTKKT